MFTLLSRRFGVALENQPLQAGPRLLQLLGEQPPEGSEAAVVVGAHPLQLAPLQALRLVGEDENLLALCAGNTLRRRGVAGPVQPTDAVEVLDGGRCGRGLRDVIAGRDHPITVDAVNAGRPPGTLVRLADNEIPAAFRTKSSPNQLGLQEVLALLHLLETAPRP